MRCRKRGELSFITTISRRQREGQVGGTEKGRAETEKKIGGEPPLRLPDDVLYRIASPGKEKNCAQKWKSEKGEKGKKQKKSTQRRVSKPNAPLLYGLTGRMAQEEETFLGKKAGNKITLPSKVYIISSFSEEVVNRKEKAKGGN